MAKKRSTVSEEQLAKIKTRVEKKIKRASQYPMNLSVVVYARPKTGKTRFCASAPKVLIIDCDEKGTDSTRDDLDPNTIRISSWTEINDVYWYLQSGDHDFESVAIDTVSGLQTLCMNWILGDEAARDTSRDPDQPSQRLYQKRTQLMTNIITNFRNLPMNVIFTAHTRKTEQGEGGEDDEINLVTGPNLAPATATHLLASVGLIGYMHKREVIVKSKKGDKTRRRKVTRTRMLIGPSERFETGVRYSALKDLDFIDSPDFTTLLEIVSGSTKLKEAAKSG